MRVNRIGRTPEISDEEIILAGERLIERQRKVSGFALRKEVGNKGFPKRLFEVWSAHMESFKEPQNTTGEPLPTVLANLLDDATSAIAKQLQEITHQANSKANELAQIKIDAAFERITQREKALDLEIADAMSAVESLEEQNESLDRALTEQTSRANSFEKRLAVAEKEIEFHLEATIDLKAEKDGLMKMLVVSECDAPKLSEIELSSEEEPLF
ncbi:hypothetical protein ST37_09985 [Vibrio sp. qd031]|nr:hypothetical protein ST37_09985 [Vibrio sp. qd031]